MSKAGSRGLRSLITGIVLLAAGLFSMVSLASDNSGALGRSLGGWLVWALGRAAWLAPLLLVTVAFHSFSPTFLRRWGLAQFIGIGLALGSGLVMAHLLLVLPPPGETRPLLPPLSYRLGEPALAVAKPLASGTGAVGALLTWIVQVAVGRAGAWILLPAVFLVGLFLLVEPYESRLTVAKRWLKWVGRLLGRAGSVLWGLILAFGKYVQDLLGYWRDRVEEQKAWKEADKTGRAQVPKTRRRQNAGTDDEEDTLEFAVPEIAGDKQDGPARKGGGLPLQRPLFTPSLNGPSAAGAARAEAEDPHGEAELVQALPAGSSKSSDVAGTAGGAGAPRLDLESVGGEKRSRHGVTLTRSFQLPPSALLTRPVRNNRGRKEVPVDQSDLLVETFRNFGIRAAVVAVHRGPTVTRYELQPAPGVKVSRIVGLADDIALALAAPGVRIEAPIPGKRAVGIEVPNPEPETVYFRDVIESEAFQKSTSPLTLALGKDLGGEPVVADLRKMIHLLIAGATGSGKSVCLNGLIASLLCKASPAEVRLLMIDPKRVELSTFDGIAHLITPVVTDPKQAAVALRWAVREMEERYELFALAGVRNIEGFNEALVQGQLRVVHGEAHTPPRTGVVADDEALGSPATGAAAPAAPAPAGGAAGSMAASLPGGDVLSAAGQMVTPAPVFPDKKPRSNRLSGGDEDDSDPVFPHAPLPYLVIIIDELADLMLVAAAEVEDAIWRLAQMARAAGIYLIIATQRPSVDVITGVIKANIPSRIAFAVSSQTDSRVILDQAGAERLLGRGDMLFFPIGASKPLRAQGALIFDRDVERLVEFWKRQAEPEYEVDVTKPSAEDDAAPDEPDDPLFDEAVRLVVEMGQASISLLQRRFRIGYSRAARLVDMMERQGIIGPAQGSKPREILIGQRLGRTGESHRP